VNGERAAAQLLHEHVPRAPRDVVSHLLAVQAQDLRSAYLAVRARSRDAVAADVTAALERREVVVTWLNRGTLHLVARDDHAWLLALTGPQQVRTSVRRLAELGVAQTAAERAGDLVERTLGERGPLTRADLTAVLAEAGVPAEGQVVPHLLRLVSLRGSVVQGPVVEGGHAFVLAREWLGEPRAVDRDRALGELAVRYLRGHGPASDADLAYWAGIPLRAARAGLRLVGDRIVEHEGGLVALTRTSPAAVPARLLPAFDPYLLGWRDRSAVVPDRYAKRVHPGGGMLRAVATVDGMAAGTWSLRRERGVTIEPFAPLDPGAAAALDVDAGDVVRFG
jgi:hypothetical protein